jgi:phosphopantothenoylcysteine decarboxylase/phosphopantothenate--cysteine ligase
MTQLDGKKVVLGITGGIAAYKTPELVRLLKSAGAQVRVILSRQAHQFVAPMALQAVLGAPIFGPHDEGETAMRHIELAKWADIILIAPATANRLAMMLQGRAEDLLGNCLLATKATIFVCPAMNQQMFLSDAVQTNCRLLQERGIRFIGPDVGEQACGDVGPGRMVNPDKIVAFLNGEGRWAGRKVLLTAGPTREPIDPVRFLSNRSSGKMGYALAEAFVKEGAEVILISGPTKLTSCFEAKTIKVQTAQQMLEAVLHHVKDVDVFVSVAAVADYTPISVSPTKIKKDDDTHTLVLKKNPDILATVAQLQNRPYCVGFAAETHNGLEFAREKLIRKKIDMIALNDVGETSIGFDSSDNEVSLITRTTRLDIPKQSKHLVATQIVDELTKVFVPTHADCLVD